MSANKATELFSKKGVVLFDAAMGTALQEAGQPPGTGSEEMNLLDPGTVSRIHRENIRAGSDVITTNTFGVSAMFLRGEKERALECLAAGVLLAKQAAGRTAIPRDEETAPSVAFCIGPAGVLLGPFGETSYEMAEEAFEAQAGAGARCGADFILLETFADIEEFARAARVAKKSSGLPVLGTMSFAENGHTYMGATPADLVSAARAEGLSALGANCSLGPQEMGPIIEEIMGENAAEGLSGSTGGIQSLPVIAQPNAGQPVYKDGKTTYEITTEEFIEGIKKLIDRGISGVGGCCGTTPAMIAAIRGMIDGKNTSGGKK